MVAPQDTSVAQVLHARLVMQARRQTMRKQRVIFVILTNIHWLGRTRARPVGRAITPPVPIQESMARPAAMPVPPENLLLPHKQPVAVVQTALWDFTAQVETPRPRVQRGLPHQLDPTHRLIAMTAPAAGAIWTLPARVPTAWRESISWQTLAVSTA